MEIQYLLYNKKIWVLIKNPLDHIIKGVIIMYHVKNYDLAISLQTATFCGQQGRISRTVRAILSGQPGISAGQRVLRPTNQYCSLFQEKAMLSQSVQ